MLMLLVVDGPHCDSPPLMAESYTEPLFQTGVPTDPTTPVIQVTARDRLFQEVRRKMLPSEIEGILASAIDGSL